MTISFKKIKLTFFLAILVTALLSIVSYSNVLAATVGQQLLQPESGWARYDDSDNNISYLNHTKGTGASYWNNSCTMINSGGYARFNFTGDKLRIISYKSPSQSILSLYIDGIYIGDFNAYNSFNLVKVLAFDIQGLENKEHCVELKYDGNKMITLDAIDIDENGELKPYNTNSVSVTNVTLNKSTADIFVDGTEQLLATILPSDATNKTITWTSSDLSVATVDSTGKVTAIAPGTSTITATTSDGSYTATCTVNVLPKSNTRAKLTITMTNGIDKEYDLSMTEVDNFITWYDDRANGTGTSYYTFTKTLNVAPYIRIKQYVIFDKIVSFDVSEYNQQ